MPAHWLRRNERTRTPVRVVCIDTESRTRHDEAGSAHAFRLAVASFDVRRSTGQAKARTAWSSYRDQDALWDEVDAFTTVNHAVWLYAHNLEYDLTAGGAWDRLPALGWEVAARAAGGSAPWVRWRRGDRSLTCADLAGWVRRPLGVIGEWMGVRKQRMPGQDAPDDAWEAYCRRDVEVLRAAVLELMAWVDGDGLGNWSLSSAGQAWRTFRHKFLHDQLLVHDDPVAAALERAASFGGRREVFRTGTVAHGPVVELDYRSHYLATAGLVRVPRQLRGVVARPDPVLVSHWRQALGVIADVEVTTALPVVPCRTPAGIVYPVGRFRTCLAGPELDLVEETGGSLKYHRCALYLAGPVLVPWSQWLFDRIHGARRERDPLRAHVLKQWSRELIGKFGQRSSELVRIGDPQPGRAPLERYYPAADRTAELVLNRPDGTWLADRSRPGENALPAIYATICSAARVALWRALEAVGPENVLACDTDSLLALLGPSPVTAVRPRGGFQSGAAGGWELGQLWRGKGWRRLPGQLAVKAVWDRVELRSPEAMVLDGRPKVAGVPRSARRTGPWDFTAELWPGADWQLEHRGEADYRTVVRTSHVVAAYTRRQVLPDGSTRPWEAAVAHGRTVIPGLGLE